MQVDNTNRRKKSPFGNSSRRLGGRRNRLGLIRDEYTSARTRPTSTTNHGGSFPIMSASHQGDERQDRYERRRRADRRGRRPHSAAKPAVWRLISTASQVPGGATAGGTTTSSSPWMPRFLLQHLAKTLREALRTRWARAMRIRVEPPNRSWRVSPNRAGGAAHAQGRISERRVQGRRVCSAALQALDQAIKASLSDTSPGRVTFTVGDRAGRGKP